MKRYCISCIFITEIQIIGTMRYCIYWNGKICNTNNIKCEILVTKWNSNFHLLLDIMQNCTANLEHSLADSYKRRHTLITQSLIVLLDICPKKLKMSVCIKPANRCLQELFNNCQYLEPTRCPSAGIWINKLYCSF